MKHLVIVESPAKAKTIQKYLGKEYEVASSVGHIRDLPSKELGVNIDQGYTPSFVTIKGKEKVIKDLKSKAKGKSVLLASDMDREGEAIAWHIAQVLDLPSERPNRVIFSEITETAIQKAILHPKPLSNPKVQAQFTRRILDRLVGYQISPLLWRVLHSGRLSAGRVQSVALRLICALEESIQKFIPEEYWKFRGVFDSVEAWLTRIDQKSLEKFPIRDEKKALETEKDLRNQEYFIAEVKKNDVKKRPLAPFITSTLQQEASNKLGFSVDRTMKLAQQLYEGVEIDGNQLAFITYMRTDSTRLSKEALESAKTYITTHLGSKYYQQRTHFSKKGASTNIQDAHEAIRPTYPELSPDQIKNKLSKNLFQLYSLIWNRFMASQSAEAIYEATKIVIKDRKGKYQWEATGNRRLFDGFEFFYPAVTTEKPIDHPFTQGQSISLGDLETSQHYTQPPKRFSEATLVKRLEKEGIGRPSTYASIVKTLFDRKYVLREAKTLRPSFLGALVNDFLENNFAEIVETRFTADLERKLDAIEDGNRDWKQVLEEFYVPFSHNLQEKQEHLSTGKLHLEQKTNIKCPECDQEMVLKVGRYGPYLHCSECKKNLSVVDHAKMVVNGETFEFDPESHQEMKSSEPVSVGRKCPKCQSDLVERNGRFGKFIACSNYPDCKYTETINQTSRGSCPLCGKKVFKRKSKKGRTFFVCEDNHYSGGSCTYISWNEPSEHSCPDCKSSLVYKYNKADGEYLYCPACKKKAFSGDLPE